MPIQDPWQLGVIILAVVSILTWMRSTRRRR